MLLTASPNFDSCDVQIAPLQEVDVCCRLQEGDEPTSTTDTSTTSGVAADTTTHTSSATGLPLRLPLHYYHLTSTTHLARTFGGNRRRLDSDDGDPCSQDSEGLKKKRKFEDTVDDDDAVQKVDTCRRLLISRKGLLDAGKGDNIPLFYLYGDLLLIPKFKWSNGDGVRSGRRRSRGEPEMNVPSDPNDSTEASPHLPRPRTPSLHHLEMFMDSQSLEEVGFNQNRFNRLAQFVISDLNKYGVCVIENFLGENRADQIRAEVGGLHRHGVFHDGEVMARQDQARGRVRGDKIAWVTGSEPNCSSIGQLVSVVDSLVAKCNNHQQAGKLASYNIKWRTRAMVACYPGQGTHYVKHVDNPNGDGRCITAIYYINKNWRPQDGGVLRIYPEGTNKVAIIEPLFDRMLFFWSDRRNPHEVMPASVTRYAITVWYLDQNERENYLSRIQSTSSST
ncbi:prolyl hydroxylase EGLN2-like isoform X2 [Penaeus japonicus]|uniref:prolyl hydroxylase EGLN2-like isoform X2 n=1 Tax=Penaeus japonicus TaxID=27405 RepID=UPI001C7121B5|nr:prolyl hydroxylase EGLN2-like isoform X2 [Penaeus japonicus]